MAQSPDRLFVLFIHYNLKEGRDWHLRNLEIRLRRPAETRLRQDIDALKHLLEPGDGWQGFAFLFLDPGWKDLVQATGLGAAALGARLANFQHELRELVLERPVRLVTAYHLIDLLSILSPPGAAEPAKGLADFMVGPAGELRYDSVKVIEAVIRIANFSRNAPILRFDDDVIFPRTGNEQRDRERMVPTRNNVLELCRRFDELSTDPDVHYFVFSGGYLPAATAARFAEEPTANPPADRGEASELTAAAISGFATRIVQLCELPPLEEVAHLDPGDPDPALDEALRAISWDRLDLAKVHRFLHELWRIGANPFRQVISGAGLCLSDSAILDLPPYSNMRENVMWIDDHLKFSLHHELRHFGLPPDTAALAQATRHGIGRVDGPWFRQQRHLTGVTLADVRWHTREYLPRLLRGAIADSWLREDPRLKCPAERFSQEEWIEIIQSAPGGYARHFIAAVRQTDGDDIRRYLHQLACRRLQRIVELWSADPYAGTFLHLVTTGAAPAAARWQELGFFPEAFPDGLAAAVAALSKPRRSDRGTPPPLARLVEDLIDDFLAYPKLVLFWKSFVQATRFLLNDQPALFWPFPIPYERQAVARGLAAPG